MKRTAMPRRRTALRPGGPLKSAAERRKPGTKRTPPEIRLARLTKPGPVPGHRPDLGHCALFTGSTNGKGYGQFHYYRDGRRAGYAHRFAWEHANGPIPAGLTIDHLCRVTLCVNVTHMELVEGVENTRRAKAARTACRFGHSLTPDNLYVWNGRRYCRTCRMRRSRDRAKKVIWAGQRRGRALVGARSGGLCECCGMRQAAEWQHRVRRSQGGTWDGANGLHACRPCHKWITEHPKQARIRGWHVWSHEDPASVPVLRRDSWVLLTADGGLVAVLHHSGGPEPCEGVLDRPGEPGLRCGLGEWHDGDHECGLVTWPVSSEERASV